MRLSAILSEAARNVERGTTRAVLFALLLGCIVGALATADGFTLHSLEVQARAFQASGAATRILQSEGAIHGATCDALSRGATTISASGALSEAHPVELAALPTTSIPAFHVTPGLVRLVGGSPAVAGAWISDALATTLAVSPGAQMQTTIGTVTIAGVYAYPNDGRDNRLGFAMLVPVIADTSFDECWATAWPVGESTDLLLRSAAFSPGSTDALQVGQLNKRFGATFDGTLAFESRITAYVYPLGALIALGLGWVSIRARQLEHAAALHAGQRRPEQLATILIETSVWAGLGCLIAGLVVFAFAVITDSSPSATLQPTATAVLPLVLPALPIAFAAALVGAAVAAFTTRERHLFRYFKERR